MYKRRSFSIVFRNYNHRDKARERGGGGEGGGGSISTILQWGLLQLGGEGERE